MSKNNCISVISYAIITVPYKCNNYRALEMAQKVRGNAHSMQPLNLYFNKEELVEIENTKENT